MVISRFVTKLNETNMYFITEDGSDFAILIDPSDIQRIHKYTEGNGLKIEHVILTHEHYDHIAALNEVRSMFPKCKVIASKKCSDMIQDSKKNMSKFFNVILEFKHGIGSGKQKVYDEVLPYEADAADIVFEETYAFMWEGHSFELMRTPGHSQGSILIDVDKQFLFSGDTVSHDYDIITRLPGGNLAEYERITLPILKSFSGETMVYPGHGTDCKLMESRY